MPAPLLGEHRWLVWGLLCQALPAVAVFRTCVPRGVAVGTCLQPPELLCGSSPKLLCFLEMPVCLGGHLLLNAFPWGETEMTEQGLPVLPSQ